MHFLLTALYFLRQSVLVSQVKKDTMQRRRSRRSSLYGFLDQKYNTVHYLNDPWYLARCERMRHKQVSRCAQSTPRASQQPRHYTQKGGVRQPWESRHKTNWNTDTPGKMSAVRGSVGHTHFLTRHLLRDVRVLNRLSEGMCKTLCCTKASRICCGTHPAFFQFKLMALSPRVKRPEREAYHSSPSLTDTENAWSSTFTSYYVFMEWSLRSDRAVLLLL